MIVRLKCNGSEIVTKSQHEESDIGLESLDSVRVFYGEDAANRLREKGDIMVVFLDERLGCLESFFLFYLQYFCLG